MNQRNLKQVSRAFKIAENISKTDRRQEVLCNDMVGDWAINGADQQGGTDNHKHPMVVEALGAASSLGKTCSSRPIPPGQDINAVTCKQRR